MSRDDEKLLAERLIRGETSAFREFVEAYKKRVYGLAYEFTKNHADAEDVSQVAFMKVYKSIGTFDRDASLNSWLYRIVVNAAIDHIRKRPFFPADKTEAVPGRFADDGIRHASSRSGEPQKEAEMALMRKKIENALALISEREKTVFLLRHYHDLNLKEIAVALGISLGSVKSYLFRSIKKIQKELGVSHTPLEPGG
jgi:RNA polymerase sigma-70 factor (ECF subfamily)